STPKVISTGFHTLAKKRLTGPWSSGSPRREGGRLRPPPPPWARRDPPERAPCSDSRPRSRPRRSTGARRRPPPSERAPPERDSAERPRVGRSSSQKPPSSLGAARRPPARSSLGGPSARRLPPLPRRPSSGPEARRRPPPALRRLSVLTRPRLLLCGRSALRLGVGGNSPWGIRSRRGAGEAPRGTRSRGRPAIAPWDAPPGHGVFRPAGRRGPRLPPVDGPLFGEPRRRRAAAQSTRHAKAKAPHSTTRA